MSDMAGRSCPLRYRYGLPAVEAETLYVLGGLYGNLPALDVVERLAAAESGPVTLIFNGDFNWFDVDDTSFAEINRRVLAHHAIVGNVEAELGVDGDAAGCGCAYPDHVDSVVVERSNRIHARLKASAAQHPDILAALAGLPMIARFAVGGQRVAVVHGDADSLAGWRFDAAALSDPQHQPWLVEAFHRADVDIFASTHTCLPALRRFSPGLIANNGAAGMPNFSEQRYGLLTRISTRPPGEDALYGEVQNGVHIHALPIRYDHTDWVERFLANWPEGSDAWLSYFKRIEHGPDYLRPRIRHKAELTTA